MSFFFLFFILAIQSLRVITGCGSHGVGKSKLKTSVRVDHPLLLPMFEFNKYLSLDVTLTSCCGFGTLKLSKHFPEPI